MISKLLTLSLFAFFLAGGPGRAEGRQASTRRIVDEVILPLMKKDGIPGMAVGLIADGRPLVLNYGVASLKTRRLVDHDTIFEIGSCSKTLTATLAQWAQAKGYLGLSDRVDGHLADLAGSQFGGVTLLELGTHTPGGLPLQVPEDIHDDGKLLRYLKAWEPKFKPGSYRTYTNIGIGTLGLLVAKNRNEAFPVLMRNQVLLPLGMRDTFYTVPKHRLPDYAQGYTRHDHPIRLARGELWAEAYGVKTTARDMLRFLAANMGEAGQGATLGQAIIATHTGYFKAGAMVQDLIWEQYPYPVSLKTLLQGNSPDMAFDATPVARITPPSPPRADVWINKTGSTNGFGAYIAFVPGKHLGIVMLANKNYPIADRVTAAHAILSKLR